MQIHVCKSICRKQMKISASLWKVRIRRSWPLCSKSDRMYAGKHPFWEHVLRTCCISSSPGRNLSNAVFSFCIVLGVKWTAWTWPTYSTPRSGMKTELAKATSLSTRRRWECSNATEPSSSSSPPSPPTFTFERRSTCKSYGHNQGHKLN